MRSRFSRRRLRALAVPLVVLATGCGGSDDPPSETTGRGFEERAAEAGIDFHMTFLATEQGETFKINLYDHGAGVAVADFDGDGDDDIYLLNQLGPNALLRNDGKGAFEDVTEAAGPVALANRICSAALFNDLDNDGDQDLFVTTTRGGNALFENDGKGRFTDVTARAGLTWVGHSQGASAFDAEGDGDLDLLVTNTAQWTTDAYHPRDKYYFGVRSLVELVESPIELNVFYRNNGDGTFTNATADAGLEGVGWGGDIAVFDYDEDGDLDLYVSNMFGRSLLYRNDGKGRFDNVAATVLGRTPWGTVGAKAFDYDGDAHLDLFVSDMHSDMWVPIDYDFSKIVEKRKYKKFFGPLATSPDFQAWQEVLFAAQTNIQYDTIFFGSALYRNLGGGKFEEVSDKAGTETFLPWGIANGDYDNDGFQDVYIPSGMGFPWQYWRSALLMNNGDGTFTDRSGSTGIDPPPGGKSRGTLAGRDDPRSSRSAAVADFDGDGKLDIIANNFNDRPYLYMNRWPRRSYVAFRLEGRKSNRDAVGSLVYVRVGDRTMVRQVHAAGGYLAQSSKTVHFGLGDAKDVERVEIRWPGGRTQVIESPEINRVHDVVEPTE